MSQTILQTQNCWQAIQTGLEVFKVVTASPSLVCQCRLVLSWFWPAVLQPLWFSLCSWDVPHSSHPWDFAYSLQFSSLTLHLPGTMLPLQRPLLHLHVCRGHCFGLCPPLLFSLLYFFIYFFIYSSVSADDGGLFSPSSTPGQCEQQEGRCSSRHAHCCLPRAEHETTS